MQSLDREIAIWTVLEHRYVLRLHGTVMGFGPFRALVSPWMSNGTLNSYLNRAYVTLMTTDKLLILTQIAEGLKYLHDNRVTHGDLTSSNVLIDADGSACLADFGISNLMTESNPTFSYHLGAVRWAAPELFVNPDGQVVQCATKSSDIYSLGCIMLQILSGQVPWSAIRPDSYVLARLLRQHVPPVPQEISKQDLYFLQQCFSLRPADRPSADQILAFVRGESLHCIPRMPRIVEATAVCILNLCSCTS
ncbi:kinase-like domain-containing protein [Suillus lakei]|nr:kinase-like domain-containing protein [Suillus lakei]